MLKLKVFKLENARIPERLIYIVVDIKPKPFCPFCSVNWSIFLFFHLDLFSVMSTGVGAHLVEGGRSMGQGCGQHPTQQTGAQQLLDE